MDLTKINNLDKNLWFFRFKKFDENTYLITNDVAKYSFLTKEEFWDFISWKIISWDKYEELKSKNFIKDENYEEKMPFLYAKKNEFLWFWPSLHIVVTTLRCNHKCQYCHAAVGSKSAKEMDMSIETAKKVVDTIFYTSNTHLTIEFQWWESLLNWDVVKYITEYSKEKAKNLQKVVQFALVTNLTLMDDEKLDYIMNENIRISTSLDWDEELHNYNRVFNNWNSFKEVTYWIKKINKEYEDRWIVDGWWKPIKVWALLTVTKKSLPKYKEIIDTYIEVWLDWIYLRPVNPYWFAASDLDKLSYSMDDFIEFYNNSMDYIIELNKKWIHFREYLSSIYLTKILTQYDPNFMDERSPCWACIWQVAYNYDWKIYSCDEWRMLWRMWDDNFLMTQLWETWRETYQNMIESETTKIMVQASTLDWLPWYNESVYKPYLWVCPIHTYKLTWNIIANYKKDTRTKLWCSVLDYLFKNLKDNWNEQVFKKWIWK